MSEVWIWISFRIREFWAETVRSSDMMRSDPKSRENCKYARGLVYPIIPVIGRSYHAYTSNILPFFGPF